MNDHGRNMKNPVQTTPLDFTNAQHVPHGLRLREASHHTNTATAESSISHSFWLLELYRGGEIEVHVRPIGRRVMRSGLGLLLPPATVYSERTMVRPVGRRRGHSGNPTSTFILFDDPLGQLPPPLAPGTSSPLWIEDPRGGLQELLDRLVAAIHGKGWMTLSAAALFYQILTLVSSGRQRGRVLALGAMEEVTPQFVVTANDHMRHHLSQPLRVADIAEAAGMGESGFAHAYQRVTGRSPMRMLRALRIEAAKLHLVRGQLKLEAIADMTGFADGFHLSRTFKQITGLSPRDFLKAHLPRGEK